MKFQAEHKEWVDAMYPDQPQWMPAVGLVEEASELLRCVLKGEQEKQFGKEFRHINVDWKAEMIDAIGDCGIFAVSLCNASGWHIDEAWNAAQQLGLPLGEPKDVALELVVAGTRVASNPTYWKLSLYLAILIGVADSCGFDAEECINQTWEKVKGRKR